MNNILDFIEKHKYGIIIALVIHVGLFIYFQVTTYKEKVTYEAWEFRGRNIEAPDDIEFTPDEIETIHSEDFEIENEDISSFVRNESDQREREFKENQKYTSYEGDVYQNVKDFEKEVINKLQSGRQQPNASSNDQSQHDSNTSSEENSSEDQSSERTGDNASKKAVEGKTMVSYVLDNRKPLNNNDWHIRNPGYTCGDVNGVVVVEIKVNANGDVTNAKYLADASKNASTCMIRQAEKYALLSRFNFDANAPNQQQGRITYRFVYRR
jgi:hypothetical protein